MLGTHLKYDWFAIVINANEQSTTFVVVTLPCTMLCHASIINQLFPSPFVMEATKYLSPQ